MEKVAVNQFVKRQVKGSGKTYSESLSFETIAADAEKQMSVGNFIEGYRNGVRIVTGSDHLINEFVCLETKHLRTWQKSYILNYYNLNFDLKNDWNMAIEFSHSSNPYTTYEVNLYKDFEYQNTIAVFNMDHESNTEVTDK